MENAMECHGELVEARGIMPYHTVVARWEGKSQQGCDEQRSGRPVSVRIDLARAVIEQLMDEDRRWTLLELERASGISRNAPSTGYCVRRGVRDKRPDLEDSAIILHDNTAPHKAEYVRQLLRRWGSEKLEHPPYSPDISPYDFDLISKIKEPIRGRWFATREDITNAVRQQVTRLTHAAANAEADGIQRLPHRWQRVVTIAGDCFEGL
ncbi:histone-lysine N-methyltransferase SETMAR [Trichonephila clavipes]|nr:histone-lysine N-methyltransferase SETMAR [Trichonephila clavipes]